MTVTQARLRLTALTGIAALAVSILAGAPAASAKVATSPAPALPAHTSTILSFVGMTNIALNTMRSYEAEAEIMEVTCKPGRGGQTTSYWELTNCDFYFRLPDNRTGHITSTVWGEPGTPEIINRPRLGNRVMSWPIAMDLPQANSTLQGSEFAAPYRSLTVRWPLYPGLDQPFYIFNMANGTHIAVGTVDGSIQKFF